MGPALILGAAAIVGGGALLGGLLGKKKETTNNFNINGNQPRSCEQRRVDGRQNGRLSSLEQEVQALRAELASLKGGGGCFPPMPPLCGGQAGASSVAAFSGCGGGAVVAGFFRN